MLENELNNKIYNLEKDNITEINNKIDYIEDNRMSQIYVLREVYSTYIFQKILQMIKYNIM